MQTSAQSAEFEQLLVSLVDACKAHWQEQLKGVLLFGSTVRTLKRNTDIDLLIAVNSLPEKRRERLDLFDEIERRLEPSLSALRQQGYHLELSPKLRTPLELRHFSPLYLDMVTQSRILFEEDQLFTKLLEKTRVWIEESGARKVQRGLKWYWVLGPGKTADDVFDIGWVS